MVLEKRLGDRKKMFGILEKMDRFSNKLMSREEKINFMQEIVDNGMVWQMHAKYRDEALFLMGQGKVVDKVLAKAGAFHRLDGPCFQECCIPTGEAEDVLGVGPMGYTNPADGWV